MVIRKIFQGFLLILIPVIVTAFDCITQKRDRKHFFCNLLVTGSITCAVVGSLYFLKRNTWTVYEFLFFGCVASILANEFVVKAYCQEKPRVDSVMKVIGWLSICLISYSILTYGQTIIHSDTATATLLAKSILNHHSLFPKSWNYANGDIWLFASNLFCMLPMKLMSNQSMARMIGSLIFVLLTFAVIIWQSKKFFHDDSWVISIPVLVVFLHSLKDPGGMLFYQASSTNNLLQFPLLIMLLYNIYCDRITGKKKMRSIFFYCLIMITYTIGGIRAGADLVVPCIGTCMVMVYVEIVILGKKRSLRNPLVAFGATLISAAVGIFIYKWLCTWHNVNNSVNNEMVFAQSLPIVWENLKTVLINHFSLFGYIGGISAFSTLGLRNFVAIILCAMICFVVPILQLLKIKEEKEEVQFFYCYVLIHNLEFFVVCSFLQKLEPRYALPIVLGWVFVSARYICANWLTQKNKIRSWVWVCLFAISVSIGGKALFSESKNWDTVLNGKKVFANTLVEHGVSKGYAGYWNAYSTEIYSDLNVEFGAINLDGQRIVPFYWLVDSDIFQAEDNIKSCLILDEGENAIIGENINELLGMPSKVILSDGMYVYIFDYDIVERF